MSENSKYKRGLQTKFQKGVWPGGQANAGGVIGSCEFPPQGLQEAEGHGRWAPVGADSHAGHIPCRRKAETKGRHLHEQEQTHGLPPTRPHTQTQSRLHSGPAGCICVLS